MLDQFQTSRETRSVFMATQYCFGDYSAETDGSEYVLFADSSCADPQKSA